MSKLHNCLFLRGFSALVAVLLLCLATTDAQEMTSGSGAILSSDQLIEVLRQHPEVLANLKKEAAHSFAEQGAPVQETDITDEAVFRRIEEDADLRIRLSEALQTQSHLTDGDDRNQASLPAHVQPASSIKAADVTSQPVLPAYSGQDQTQVEVARRPNPYPDLPSLQDLYTQVPRHAGSLKRFGMDIFRNGTGNLEGLPMDLPAGPDYVLGPGDGLNIDIWGSVSQRLTRTVDREGRVVLPEAGTAFIAGKTLADAERLIQQVLSSQFRNVKIDVSLTRLRTVRVYVVGEVERPGAYDISSLSTPLNALYVAGGPTARGSLRTVRHYRGRQLVREVDLYDLLLEGMRSDVERLEPGDTILVPPVGPQITVAGTVLRPAIYELKGANDLADVLQLAGGVLVSATLRQVTVERIEAHRKRVMLSLNLPEGADKEQLRTSFASFRVQDGDRVSISPILPYSDKTVYLEGHVFRPGKYPYRDGIQVLDLIRSYQDVLPEPANHAEIVRLVPPDYRPTVIEFNLADVLGASDPIKLQPFDTIRIFGRYEVDAPKVSIFGEVLRPGEYPLAEGMTAAELLRLAGGFKRSAMSESADLASYVVQNRQKILIKHRNVEIAKAASGDTAADVALKPGDVLTIRQLTGWNDIGASITLKGEVLYPGTYGIQDGERLSSVLKRAGGFREKAYPAGAMLERTQVRELQEKNRQALIRRVESAGSSFKAGSMSNQEQLATLQAMQQQQQQVLTSLRSTPASGRLVIKISSDISKWENTPEDIEMRAGDILVIPKRPNFVLVNGQVYNPAAITYVPGKNAGWYLKQAGGATELADKKAVFIVRADGSVAGESTGGWWKGSALNVRLQPGDAVMVPDKVIGSVFWKNLATTAQIMSSVALSAAVITSF